ncbi:MAG: acetyl-CoA C-acyltransferase [Bacteroidia bacterium]|nr:acetyl-CoA C-acyltransferase [Bacteroidia bacterium]
MQEAYIVAGYRSAVGKANRGGFKYMRPDNLAAEVIKHLVSSVPALDPARVDDLVVGCAVPEAEQGLQIGRIVSLLSLPMTVPGFTINRYCGSGLEAIVIAMAKIKCGMADCIIAGGTESMSLVPTIGYKTALNPFVAEHHPEWYFGMGQTAEEIAKDYGISRADQDEFSYQSHMKAIAAMEAGKFKDEIVPVKVTENLYKDGKKVSKSFVVDSDEGPRADTNLEALAKLRPVFSANGTVTAGNASQTSDGAAFVMVMSEKMVKELNLQPIARLVSYAAAGVDPRIMGIGPVAAIPKALKMGGLSINDIDLIELNEAFAVQSLAVIRDLDLDPAKINVNGGAISLGHPLACTGTKLTVQITNELRRRGQKYGMVSACVGGGQGVAGIYELLN